ncbi:hypothetical protein ACFXTN_000458 [Malus domestica]
MIGILALVRRPKPFSKLVLTGASPRFLNDREYHGGFEQEETEKMLSAMEGNYEAWVHCFTPLVVGADIPTTVREFSRILFNMRPDTYSLIPGKLEVRNWATCPRWCRSLHPNNMHTLVDKGGRAWKHSHLHLVV